MGTRSSKVADAQSALTTQLGKQVESLNGEVIWVQSQMRAMACELGELQVRNELGELRAMLEDWQAEKNPRMRRWHAQRLNARFVKQKTLLVSDMSGFSRVCKEEGILHFLCLVKAMQSICLPLLQDHGGELVKVAADNLFVLFDRPSDAVDGAFDCMAAVKAFSQGKARNDCIKLSIGIATGFMWVLQGTDVFGDVANDAFELGENVSEKEVLITHQVRAYLERVDPMGKKYSFKERIDEDALEAAADDEAKLLEHERQTGSGATPHYRKPQGRRDSIDASGSSVPMARIDVSSPSDLRNGNVGHLSDREELGDYDEDHVLITAVPVDWKTPTVGDRAHIRPVINAAINAEEPEAFLEMVGERQKYQIEDKLTLMRGVEERMKVRFMRTVTVLVLEMHNQADLVRRVGVLSYIQALLQMKAAVATEVDARGGMRVVSVSNKITGQVFALFDDPVTALYAALASCGRARKAGDYELACGISHGEVLDLETCNAFGDPVNMAFKLAEDTAVGNEVLVTPEVELAYRMFERNKRGAKSEKFGEQKLRGANLHPHQGQHVPHHREGYGNEKILPDLGVTASIEKRILQNDEKFGVEFEERMVAMSGIEIRHFNATSLKLDKMAAQHAVMSKRPTDSDPLECAVTAEAEALLSEPVIKEPPAAETTTPSESATADGVARSTSPKTTGALLKREQTRPEILEFRPKKQVRKMHQPVEQTAHREKIKKIKSERGEQAMVRVRSMRTQRLSVSMSPTAEDEGGTTTS